MHAPDLDVTLSISHDQAVERTKAALATQGFGIISEIDMAGTLKSKIGVDVPPYRILGACNPKLAHRALSADPAVGLALPCNVVVYVEGDATWVRAFDPRAMADGHASADLRAVAEEVRAKLVAAIAELSSTRGQ